MKHCKIGHSWETLKFDRLLRDFLKSSDFDKTGSSENLVKIFVEKFLSPYIVKNYGENLKVEDLLLDEEELSFIEQGLQEYILAKKGNMILPKTADSKLDKTYSEMVASFNKVLGLNNDNFLNKILKNTLLTKEFVKKKLGIEGKEDWEIVHAFIHSPFVTESQARKLSAYCARYVLTKFLKEPPDPRLLKAVELADFLVDNPKNTYTEYCRNHSNINPIRDHAYAVYYKEEDPIKKNQPALGEICRCIGYACWVNNYRVRDNIESSVFNFRCAYATYHHHKWFSSEQYRKLYPEITRMIPSENLDRAHEVNTEECYFILVSEILKILNISYI